MEKKDINAFLNSIKKTYEDTPAEVQMDEIDGEPVLAVGFESPFVEGGESAYRFSLHQLKNGVYACEILMFIYNGIREEGFSALNRLISKINVGCTFGSYRLYEEAGSVIYGHSALIDEKLDDEKALDIVFKTLSIMENTVINTYEYFYRLFTGEEIDSVIESLDEEAE